jgi:predicted ATPase
MNTNRFVLISGCSGGGKSTLLTELGRRGHATVREPGQRIVRQQLPGDGHALPWVNPEAFARRAIRLALADRAAAADAAGWVFFDRGLLDAAAALEHLSGEPAFITLGQQHRYHHEIFLTPPWPEIFTTGHERRHDFNTAVAEYERLLRLYPTLGYKVTILPKVSVPERAGFVLSMLAS